MPPGDAEDFAMVADLGLTVALTWNGYDPEQFPEVKLDHTKEANFWVYYGDSVSEDAVWRSLIAGKSFFAPAY